MAPTAPPRGRLAEHAAGYARPTTDDEGAQLTKTATKDDTRLPGFTWAVPNGELFVPFTTLLVNRRYEPAHVAQVLGTLTELDIASTTPDLVSLRHLLGNDVAFTPSW